MITRSKFVPWGAAASLVLVPALGFAQQQQQQQQSGVQQPARTLRISERFSRTLANQCDYNARVTGQLRPVSQPAAQGGGPQQQQQQQQQQGTQQGMQQQWRMHQGMHSRAQLYEPDVNLSVRVTCPGNQEVRQDATLRLRGQALTLQQIQQLIEEQAKVNNVSNGQLCTFSPHFAFVDNQLRGQSVSHACGVARGGGPQAGEQERFQQQHEGTRNY